MEKRSIMISFACIRGAGSLEISAGEVVVSVSGFNN